MNWKTKIDHHDTLPTDWPHGCLVGRVWRPDVQGPSVVVARDGALLDISEAFPSMRDLCEAQKPAASVAALSGEPVGALDEVQQNSPPDQRNPRKPWLLAPIDFQAIKAAGVTFAVSLLERVIEEQARGNPQESSAIRNEIVSSVGHSLDQLKPGSQQAASLKEMLISKGLWSQYLEVGIGPDAELFTKAQPMSAVGYGHYAGFHPMSAWNNPEPEVVLVVSSAGEIKGASLGNDVNLRDIEGRSALLLGKAKDNNASCSIGPFVRLFDESFSLQDIRQMEVHMTIDGEDGFHLQAVSSLSRISRDPTDLVAQMIGPHHQYPDGVVLFLGTLFA
ncbi:MAG: fumarylacetoacetate hydrolase, partial [Verrucomicrobia bacterium]|nr:fumarylacetoacetate hydrolase [Verrucomicrobiota bacterium]